jgi:uncharacterized protein with HEPN domain
VSNEDAGEGKTTARDRRAVEDILEFCEQAARLVARGRVAFECDEMLALASEALIQRVGEAASRLSKGFQDQHSDIPWRAIRGMRNLVAHNYGAIDHRAVWNTLASDFPTLADKLHSTAS